MKKLVYRAAQAILLCSLAATLPAFAQDARPQQNDRQKQTQRDEHRDEHGAQQPEQSHARQQTNQRSGEHQAQRPNQERPNQGAPHVQQQPSYHEQQQPDYRSQQRDHSARPSQNRSQQYRGDQGRGNHDRPAQWGRPPAHRGSYQFRSDDRSRLHSYYMTRLRTINRYNRPVFRVGGYFPYADIGYLSPLPPDVYGELPPPPPGYEMGYYDGYVVVYDPATYFIASIIDLLQ